MNHDSVYFSFGDSFNAFAIVCKRHVDKLVCHCERSKRADSVFPKSPWTESSATINRYLFELIVTFRYMTVGVSLMIAALVVE